MCDSYFIILYDALKGYFLFILFSFHLVGQCYIRKFMTCIFSYFVSFDENPVENISDLYCIVLGRHFPKNAFLFDHLFCFLNHPVLAMY